MSGRLDFHPQSPGLMYFPNCMKWSIKRIGGRKSRFSSRRDIPSRGMAATFDCADVKAALGWKPGPIARLSSRAALRVHVNRRGDGQGIVNRPLHILHVFSSFKVGGPQVRFVELAKGFGGLISHTVIRDGRQLRRRPASAAGGPSTLAGP